MFSRDESSFTDGLEFVLLAKNCSFNTDIPVRTECIACVLVEEY